MPLRYWSRAQRAVDDWLGWPAFNFLWSHALVGAVIGACVGLTIGLSAGDGTDFLEKGFGGGLGLGLFWALLMVSAAWASRGLSRRG